MVRRPWFGGRRPGRIHLRSRPSVPGGGTRSGCVPRWRTDPGPVPGAGTGGAAQSGGAQQTPTLVKKGGSVEAGEGGVSKEVQDAVASGVDTAAASALEYANYLDHQRDEGWKD